jgi:hypothetical protein
VLELNLALDDRLSAAHAVSMNGAR